MVPKTVLLRQAHPRFFPKGELSSQAFLVPKEDPNLSTYNGDDITVADAFVHYRDVLHLTAHSTWGISCSEVTAENLSSAPDPSEDNPHHCIIQFGNLEMKALRIAAKKLREYAVIRGCLYPPPPTD